MENGARVNSLRVSCLDALDNHRLPNTFPTRALKQRSTEPSLSGLG